MTFAQLAIFSSVLTIAFVYLGGKRFSPKLTRNIVGGLGVLTGLTWHGALGLADSGFVFKIGFIIAGYAMAMGLLRFRGVEG